MDDIQSWWEVPNIAHFCSLFRTAFKLLDFDIEDLEEALLTDGTEEASWLQELIVKLLTGCLPNNEISTFNYQMFLRRLFREKCKEHDRYNPFNTDVDFQLLPLRTKVDILYALCDFRLDAEDVLEQLKNLEADSLRVEPLGYDSNNSAYWYFFGTRLYREDFNHKNNKKGKSVWQVVCFTEEDWFQLAKKFKKSFSKAEKQLYCTLTENFLPELPRLFSEKEKLARKRLLERIPRRSSSRLGSKRQQEKVQKETVEEEVKPTEVELELQKKKDLEKRRREAYERRSQLRENQGSDSEDSTRYEMAASKKDEKRNKAKTRKHSNSSSSSQDRASSNVRSPYQGNNKKNKSSKGFSTTVKSAFKNVSTVGRQTNNSLASATGQIVIQPVHNPQRKKLKTSLVFRQTDEDLQTGMHKILNHVKNHDDAWPFIDPVEEEYAPNYYSIVRKPMDLQRMEERLDSGYYKSYSRFKSDFHLIVDNCRLYNGSDNEYTDMVANLLTVFEKATERYLDQITSSDEEISIEFPNSKQNKGDKLESGKKIQSNSDLCNYNDKVLNSSKKECNENIIKEIKNNKKQTMKNQSHESKHEHIKNKIRTKEKLETKKVKKKVGRKPKRSNKVKSTKHRRRSRSHSICNSLPPSPFSSSSETRPSSKVKQHKKNHGLSSTEDKKNGEKIENVSVKTSNKFKEDQSSMLSKSKETKDKHTKLRETIEKLKAKSEISNKLTEKTSGNFEKGEKREVIESVDIDKKNEKDNSIVANKKIKTNKKGNSENESDDENFDENINKNKKKLKKEASKNVKHGSYEALSLATEQTLKDINKWLDATTHSSEFSSASNSPSHDNINDELDTLGNKKEEHRKKIEKPAFRKDSSSKELKRRIFNRDPTKFLKKRELQRTTDRLQPGKSKGNLLSNVQNTSKTEEVHSLGILSKIKETKNSLTVKSDESAPKLSLGTVLDNFGDHKFVNDVRKDDEPVVKNEDISKDVLFKPEVHENIKQETKSQIVVEEKVYQENNINISSNNDCINIGKATPNLSAWFKAFGVSKVSANQKKVETKDEINKSQVGSDRKPTSPEVSPNPESPAVTQGQPISRQRKVSTGSTVSERSSFSQDMDSPRICIDERVGAYPAPYPSPLHRSPSGASPIMVSPRQDMSPKSTYPTVNGQIRVGFYQDTVSSKSSPEKSCSPRSNPQSPYPPYTEPMYIPPCTESNTYSYNNSYYSQTMNYPNLPVTAYNSESNSNTQTYSDVTKSLNVYPPTNSASYQNVNSSNYLTTANSPSYRSVNSPSNLTQMHSPSQQHVTYEQSHGSLTQLTEKTQNSTTVFPVKKRAYNEAEVPFQLHDNNQTSNQPNVYKQNYDLNNISNAHIAVDATSHSPTQVARSDTEGSAQQYEHQNIPNPRSSETYIKNNSSQSNIPNLVNLNRNLDQSVSNVNNFCPTSNLYNYSNEPSYSVNAEGPLDLNARPESKKIDIPKYCTGYTTPNVVFSRNHLSQYNLNYGRRSNVTLNPAEFQSPITTNVGSVPSNTTIRCNEYKNINSQKQLTSHISPSLSIPQNAEKSLNSILTASSSFKPEMTSRSNYNTPTTIEQSLNIRGNLTNLSHIVDRFPTESMYYSDKNLTPSQIYSKSIVTSASNLPILSQSNISMPYNHELTQSTSLYNRQISELQNSITNQPKPLPQVTEKKSKRRKSNKTSAVSTSTIDSVINSGTTNQGFQSYTCLKNQSNMEPNAISLKTASVVPGSAFNFGPTPTGLGLGPGLYSDKDTFSNFLEDYRSTPNYYMAAAAAAAHHRSTPETSDKQPSVSSTSTAYPFISTPQPRAPNYSLSGPFMPTHQTPALMDASSPIYQQYLQAGVLHQGLLGASGTYPPYPALSIRQPFDSMTRPPWL